MKSTLAPVHGCRGSVRMPASKLARKIWFTATRLGLPIGFAVASLHLGKSFSRCAAHSVQAVVTLAAWVGPGPTPAKTPQRQCPGRFDARQIPPHWTFGVTKPGEAWASKVFSVDVSTLRAAAAAAAE